MWLYDKKPLLMRPSNSKSERIVTLKSLISKIKQHTNFKSGKSACSAAFQKKGHPDSGWPKPEHNSSIFVPIFANLYIISGCKVIWNNTKI